MVDFEKFEYGFLIPSLAACLARKKKLEEKNQRVLDELNALGWNPYCIITDKGEESEFINSQKVFPRNQFSNQESR
jgi:hypothetical protein